MRTFRWQFDHDDGRVFYVYAPKRAVAATRLAAYLDVPEALIAPRLLQLPADPICAHAARTRHR